MSKLLDYSEQITGLILMGRQSATGFNPDKFAVPYQPIIKDIKEGKPKEHLYLKYSSLIQDAETAAHRVNGLGESLDFVALLDESYRNDLVEQYTQKALRHLQNGEYEKYDDVMRRITATRQSTQRLRSITADEISDEYVPYMKSGSKAWDTHIGGIPTVGLTVIGAKTYTGKTTVAITMMDKFLTQYPDREILFVTLEDMNEGWKHRAKVLLGERSNEFWKKIRVMELAGNPEEVIEEAARHPNVGAIFLDFIDYLANEADLSSYVHIYKTMSSGAKSLAVNNAFRSMSVFLLAQFGKTLYKGGVPTQNALPYAGDQFSYTLCMLYQPDGDFYSDNKENAYTLPSVQGMGYLIFWKVKNKKPHGRDFPGAIQIPILEKGGGYWDVNVKGEWFSLASETKREIVQRK